MGGSSVASTSLSYLCNYSYIGKVNENAFYREKQIQGWNRKKKESLINKNYLELHKLAECKNSTHCSKLKN